MLVDHALTLPPHLYAYVQRVRAAGPFIPPKALTPADCREIGFQDVGLNGNHRHVVDRVVRAVQSVSGFNRKALASERRAAALCKARFIAVWMCREHTGLSYPRIGAMFGGRDHTTCMMACRRVEAMIASACAVISDDEIETAISDLWLLTMPKPARLA